MSAIHAAHHERIEALAREHFVLMPYDPQWPVRYAAVAEKLSRSLPVGLVTRIEHIGSTAIPGLSAKPIVDVQVEITDPDRVRREAVPIMEDLGYEFIWRSSMGERASHYAWFILRDARGQRTEHVHMVEPDEATRDRLRFRDFLRTHAKEREQYEALKRSLMSAHANDRVAYTQGKTDFIHACLQRCEPPPP